MKYTFFEIDNFKGIKHVRLDFDAHPHSKIYTLVGLNESGKTTVLEAIDYLGAQSDEVKTLTSPVISSPSYSSKDPRDLIPMGQRDNFNGDIEIEAGFEFDGADNKKLRKFLEDELSCELEEDITDFTISKKFSFEDSELQPPTASSLWSLRPKVRRFTKTTTGKRRASKKIQTLSANGETKADWHKVVNFVKTLLPSVVYFPNFLFDFPDKIYLEESTTFTPDEQNKHRTYRTILQDVLDSMSTGSTGMTLSKHVVERAKSDDRHDTQALESVLLKMEGDITRTVFENWDKIFARKVGDKRIAVRWDKDDVGWFLQLRLKDSTNIYKISERSLGFRWFFAFMLLTQYRGFRKDAPDNVLFLLDEPASNLHPSAQRQLLDSFGKMPNCSIVYTTHSHHLINPAWLESTFVVKNAGLDYDSDQDYSANDTDITLERYRTFADNYPNQTTYFQPVLDVLDYRLSELENVPDVAMVEGKNDFHTLKLLHKLLGRKDQVNLMPGAGAGNLADVIRLYIGWGRDFIVLLDSDAAGVREQKRYEELFGASVNGRLFSLADANPEWTKSLESLFDEANRLTIQQMIYPDDAKFNKTHFNRAVQEIFLTDREIELSQATKDNFNRLFDFFAEKLPPNKK